MLALLRLLLLLVAAVLATAPAHADHPPSQARANLRTDLSACFKPVQPGDRAVLLLNQPDAFDCTTKQSAFGPGDYWARIAVPADSPMGADRLRWTSIWQDNVAITAAYPDGVVRHYVVPSAESGRFVHIGGIYTLPLRHDAAPQTLLLRIAGSGNIRGILLGPHLASAEQVAQTDAQRSALYGGFAGLCLALLTYHLVLWRAIKENYLHAYAAMIAASMIYAMSSSAGLAQLMPGIDNNVRLRINYLALAATAISALWFVRAFLSKLGFSRRFDRLLIATGTVIGLLAFAYAFLAPWQIVLLDQLYFTSYAMLIVVGVAMFRRGWNEGGRIERMFVMAWVVPLLFNTTRLLHAFDLLPQSFWLDNATLIAMSIEALLSSVIIAHRIRKVHADRDLARADVAVARQQADTDDLTGLSNRRALMRTVCPPPQLAGTYRLVLIDVDHFKRINDSVGHSAGDKVLCRIAEMIEAVRRPDALAARLGGEEFALIYKSDTDDRRYHTGLLDQVRALPAAGGQHITVSMGAATGWLGGSEADWLALYRAADKALYDAKAAGRDRLVVAPLYHAAKAQAA
ncbi:MAG: diguanylate cyclase [Sphingopyxis sp.]|nr:diguanylate cyclase [Sphingopyxis sp.]